MLLLWMSMGNCLPTVDLPNIRIKIRSNCCNTDVMEGPTDSNINKELSVVPEEDDEPGSSISFMSFHDCQRAEWLW